MKAGGSVLASRVGCMGKDDSYLEDMPPVLALVIQSLIEHFHDLDKVIPVDQFSHGRERINGPQHAYWL